MLVSRTVEGEGMCECQHGNVPAVVVNVGVHKWQVAAVVNDGLHLGDVSVDRFVVDRAQQHTPAIYEAIPPGIKHFVVMYAMSRRLNLVSFITAHHLLSSVAQAQENNQRNVEHVLPEKPFVISSGTG